MSSAIVSVLVPRKLQIVVFVQPQEVPCKFQLKYSGQVLHEDGDYELAGVSTKVSFYTVTTVLLYQYIVSATNRASGMIVFIVPQDRVRNVVARESWRW